MASNGNKDKSLESWIWDAACSIRGAVLGLVQRAIEQQERLIALTTELKRTLLHKLFTEGLHGEPQKQTEIGPVPESWEVVPLGSLAKVGNGSTPKRANAGYWRDGTIPWLNSTKIHELFITEADQFVTDLAVKECHLPRVKPGSLLIAITGQGKRSATRHWFRSRPASTGIWRMLSSARRKSSRSLFCGSCRLVTSISVPLARQEGVRKVR